MKKVRRSLLVGALVVAVAAISAAPAGADQQIERPFTSTANGTLVNEPLPECDFSGLPLIVCDQDLSTDVIGTHLGASTLTGEGLLTINTIAPCSTPTVPDGVEFQSTMAVTIVAASGDKLYAEVNVSGCSDGVGLTEPTGTYEFTGGTGRFEGAAGAGDVASSVLPGGTQNFSTVWTGTITY